VKWVRPAGTSVEWFKIAMGLGEHMGRYAATGRDLLEDEFAVTETITEVMA